MATVGPLLTRAITRMQGVGRLNALALAAHFGGDETVGALPLYLKIPLIAPGVRESWKAYKGRVESEMLPLQTRIRNATGLESDRLIAGNALQVLATPDQALYLASFSELEIVELDPLVQVTTMDDATVDIDLVGYRTTHLGQDGAGVRVAVLDSGIDLHHPCLNVHHSSSTCGESDLIPGSHGTHCAGSIASTDATYAGVAPGVELYNIKVLRANGTGTSAFITKGIDAALDLNVHVLSMSLGFNHLPAWWTGGHGWSCPTGNCPLCTAVDNASLLENTVCVVAAGNEHASAAALRAAGQSGSFDTELGCPGQAREAITVGALHKSTFVPADFSSHGPTLYGIDKPVLAAPGVNVTSTIPVPRDAHGKPTLPPPRSMLFGRKSGTSMATPIVAGAAALVVQQYLTSGSPWTPAIVRSALLARGVRAIPFPANVVGDGRLLLTGP